MQGVLVFRNLDEAEQSGFLFYDRQGNMTLVRKMTSRGWALALVRSN
jgi:hypothetical protein